MTGPEDSEDTKQISVAELLARNGTVGSPSVTRRRRRRRGDDSVSVAELTGEIPIIREGHRQAPAPPDPAPAPAPPPSNGGVQVLQPPPEPAPTPPAEEAGESTLAPEKHEPEKPGPEPEARSVYWAEPEPRWPKSEPVTLRKSGPERSEYPRPMRHVSDGEGAQSGAEDMSPDPVGHYTDASVDVMDSEVRDAESSVEDPEYVPSYLQGPDSDSGHTLFGGQSLADEVARRRGGPAFDEDGFDSERARPRRSRVRMATVGHALLTVLQSILAVAFGGGLFIAFDQLWRWNAVVALVLSVLVILGLVVGVRVVRKTEDIGSTLIAVAVGALITLGPMALLQTG